MDLADLIKRDNIEAHWFWTHEVPTGPDTEYEVWDLLLIRDTYEPDRWVTDGETRRTAYFRGIGGSRVDSRRETAGERRQPELAAVLGDLLADASQLDEMPTLVEWLDDRVGEGAAKVLDYYESTKRNTEELKHFLLDKFAEYLNAEH